MAKLLDIITDPNPILRQRSKDVPLEQIKSNSFQELCEDMANTMLEKDGVGLAAPQIGQNIRVIIVYAKDGAKCIINPQLFKKSWRKEWGEEGCLSVPNVFGQVKRHKKSICVFTNRQGQKQKINCQGLMARIMQHEIDHLDGILFIDKARNLKTLKGHKTGNKNKISDS